jgi:hypothetical protein
MMARMDSQPEKMEAVIDVFEEGLDKMDTTELEDNPKKSDAIEKHQEVPKEEAAVEIIAGTGEPIWGLDLAKGHR